MRRHSFKELVAEGALACKHFLVEYLAGVVRDVDRQNNVCIDYRLELRVDESFIEIQYECLLISLFERFWRK